MSDIINIPSGQDAEPNLLTLFKTIIESTTSGISVITKYGSNVFWF